MSSSKKALEQMHEIVANELGTVLKEGVTVIDSEGEAHRNPAPPAYFSSAIKFLADNNVKCDPLKNKPLQNLIKALPFEGAGELDDEDDVHPKH